jgi:hypothetical protein
LPAKDRNGRQNPESGNERQSDELLRLIHGEIPGRLVLGPRGEQLTSLRQATLGSAGRQEPAPGESRSGPDARPADGQWATSCGAARRSGSSRLVSEVLPASSIPAPQLAATIIVSGTTIPRLRQQTATSEDKMNEKRASKSPNWGLLLLVAAAVIVAKGAMRRRVMWESAWGGPGAAGRGYGHHGRFGGGEGQSDGPGTFRLPPKIEWVLSTWHTNAHQAAETTEPSTASVNEA